MQLETNHISSQHTQHHFIQLPCKIVASIESSTENYSIQSHVQEAFNFAHAQPFNDHISEQKYSCKNINKLDQELSSIDKLKTQYQSRHQRVRTYNTQNSQKSRSIQKKHTLKPSQTPFFTKRFQIHKTSNNEIKQTQQRLRSFYAEAQMKSCHKDQLTLQMQTNQSQILQLTNEISKLQEKLALKDEIIQQMTCTISELRKQKSQRGNLQSQIKEENKTMKLQLQNIKIEKQKIEIILKDILYQREKQKLKQGKQIKQQTNKKYVDTFYHHSNANSNRKSFASGRCNVTPSSRDENINRTIFLQKQIISGSKASHRENKQNREKEREKSQRSPLLQIPISQQCKKMKVQNILDKLKIKINKN